MSPAVLPVLLLPYPSAPPAPSFFLNKLLNTSPIPPNTSFQKSPLNIAVKIVLKILSILIDIVSKLPVIRQFNEVGGLIYGLIQGVFIILLVMTAVAIFTPLTGAYEVANIINQSHVGAFFYNNNIILNIIF